MDTLTTLLPVLPPINIAMLSLTAFLATAPAVLASWDGNLNYRSPSLYHENLGIDMGKVQNRSLEKRDYIEWKTEDLFFTHGVASVSRCRDSSAKG